MALFRPLAMLLPILIPAGAATLPPRAGPDYYVMRQLQREAAATDPGLTVEGLRPAPIADGDYGDIRHVWGTPRRTQKLRPAS